MNRIFFLMITFLLDIVGVISFFMFEGGILSLMCWMPFYVWILGVPLYHIKYDVAWSD